jgi:hypothetical protein
MAVRGHTIYVAQDFAGVLTKITRNSRTDIATNPGGEIAGVDVRGNTVYYTTTNGDPTTGQTTAAALHVLRNGQSSVLFDTFQFESDHNPDSAQTYGFESISDECAAQWPVDLAGPPQYSGIPDSHPYAVAAGAHEVYVADAAGNDILAVDRWGNPRVVALLPPQPLVITAEAANANGLPSCTVGLTYDFEPVPTDVEIGHDGMLYVTTLPGGPEDPSLGARGSVYRINPWTGDVQRIATGFAGATNLAIGRHGSIFVSELFGNQVSRVVNGGPQPVVQLTNPAALEYAHGRLYVGYDVFANGSIATIDWSHGDDQNDD